MTELIQNKPDLKNTGELMRMAEALATSDMVPKDYKNKPANICAAVFAGAEIGLPPMAALKTIAVVNGRPSIWGDGLPAVVMRSGKLKRFEETIDGEGDNRAAVVTLERSDIEGVMTRRFSVADAKRAGLWDERKTIESYGKTIRNPSPWHNYPDRMLLMRAKSWAYRDLFADYLSGLHVAEEVRDIPPSAPIQVESESLDVLDVVPEAPEEPEVIDVAAELPESIDGPLADYDEHDTAANIRRGLELCESASDALQMEGEVAAAESDGLIDSLTAQALRNECRSRAKGLAE